MRITKIMKKSRKRFVSALLVLSVMLGLFVPFDLTVFAEESGGEAATGEHIYAFLNYIDSSKTSNKEQYNLELVFKNENVKDSNYYKGPYTKFADIEYVATTYKFDSTGRPAKTWNYNQWNPQNTASANRLPWINDSENGNYIRKVTFKNKIAPKSIAGWFCNCRYLCKFENFENLDVSRCENMAYAFWTFNTGTRGDSIKDGDDNLQNKYIKSLDLSDWDTSKCQNFDCFINSSKLETLDMSNFTFKGLDDNIVDVESYGTMKYYVYDASKSNPYTVGSGTNPSTGKRRDGFPAYHGAIRSVSCLIYNCQGLSDIKLDNFDFAKIEHLSGFIVNTNLSKIDLRPIKNDPIHVYSAESMFSSNLALSEIIFGEEGNPFEIGTEPMYLGYPRNGGIDPFRPDEVFADAPAGETHFDNGYRSNAIWLGSFLNKCPALVTVDLKYLQINGFGKKADGTDYDANSPDYGSSGFDRENPNLGGGIRPQMNNFFSDCTSLERIDNLKNIGYKSNYSGAWPTRQMFQNCKNLTEIDLSNYWANLGGPMQFTNCKSLKKLDLSNMGRSQVVSNYWYTGAYDIQSRGFQSYYDTDKTKPNVFEGCTELSEVVLSPYYYGATPEVKQNNDDNARPAKSADQVLTYTPDGYSSIEKDIPPVPADAPWVKIKQPEQGAFQLSDLRTIDGNLNYWMNTNRDFNVKLTDMESFNTLNDVGSELSTLELFGDYKPHYAGTWVRTSKIALIAKGSNIERQTIKGAVGLPVSYDPDDIQPPVRPGYEFVGWFATDEEDNKKNLADQLAVNQSDPESKENFTAWAYNAEWTEHKYNLVLDGNLGSTTIDGQTVTSYTAKENLLYSENFELNSTMFTRAGGYILSGWNTRPNGSGDEYAANESVSKLSTDEGATVTLYAQWHKPDVILHFDANYSGAESLPDKNYTLSNDPQNPTLYGDLAEASRTGYTFVGWYTKDGESDGWGKMITSSTQVDPQYKTLYAKWQKDPVVTFDANGGYFENSAGDRTTTTVIRQYKYNQKYGVLPTPVNDNAVLKGWYTKNGSGGDWGNELTSAAENGNTEIPSASDKIATESKTYYARWGYRPEFESNGGVYKTYDNYPVQDSNQYVIATAAYNEAHPDDKLPTLPTFKDDDGFEGWCFGEENINEYLKTHDTYTIDMSSDNVVEAKWTPKTVYEVKLNTNGGSLPVLYETTKNNTAYYRVNVYAGNTVEELPTPTKTSGSTVYEFLGWYTKNGENDDWGEQKDYTFAPESNTELYAKWAPKNITVTFDAGEGTLYLPTDASMTVYSGGKLKHLPGANRSGYIFGGWYTDLDDETTKLEANATFTANAAYHAKWIKLEDITITQTTDDKLYEYSVRWDTPSNEYATSIGDNLIIAPTNGNASLSATVYIRFVFDKGVAFTDNKTLPVGSVKIKVPKHIFKDKDGKWVGSDNISNGLSKTDTANCHFIYDDSDTDYYIITNNEVIDKTSDFNNQVFQIDYRLEPSELRNMNGGWTDEHGSYAGQFYTHQFPVTIQVDRDYESGGTYDCSGDDNTDYTKNLNLEVHSNVSASPSKTRSTVYFEWQEEWGAAPQDENQYFYVVWDLAASFDARNSQNFKFTWNEDTVHNGSVVLMKYGSTYSATDYMGPGTYHATVVTKHPRKTSDSGWKTVYNEAVLNLESLSGYKQQIRVGKEDGVYLISGYGRTFEKYIYHYKSADRIRSGGTELILNRSGVEDLKYEIEYREKTNKDTNKIWYPTSKTYSVAERNIEITDGAKGHGDVVMSSVSGNDRYNWGSSSDVILSDADYSFTKLDIFLTEYDAIQVNSEWSEPYEHTAIRDYGDVEVWTRGENESSFRLFRTLTASDFSETDPENESEDPGYGTARAANITLPERTAGYKLVHKSSFYTTRMMVCPTLFLRSTNKVFSFVQDNMLKKINTLIKNNASLNVDDTDIADSKHMDQGGAQLSSYELKTDESYLYAQKKCADKNQYYVTDTTEGTQEFPVLISGYGINRTGSTKLIQSGVFYDLLPYNFTVDKSTVRVTSRRPNTNTHPHNYGGNNTFNNAYPTSMYSVEFFENWENSGRTMMKVTITGVPDYLALNTCGFDVWYKMKTKLSNLIANGTSQMNYVSFTDTTPSQTVPVSRYSSLSSLDSKVVPYYQGINGENSDFTAFSSDSTHCLMPSQYTVGFNSSVKTEGVFMMEDKTVGLDTDYSYNVTFTDGESEASDIVIYDVIENNFDDFNCAWNGTFQSVNVSAIQNMEDMSSSSSKRIYCAPKVYYLVKDGEVTNDDLDLPNHPENWQDTVPSDKSTIKAIAIDCRTNSNKGAFTLPAKKALSFNVSMHSPDTSAVNDLITYNVASVKAKVGNDQNSSKAITRLMLHYGTPFIGKISFPESGKDANHRVGVVNGSTINYSLTITNPDMYVPIRNIVVEDVLDTKLKVNTAPKVSKGNEAAVPINNAAGISYSVETQQDGKVKFSAFIDKLDKNDSVTIIVPATVTNAANGYTIDNTAYITSADGSDTNIQSDTTYHYVTNTQAKIKKVNARHEGLAGAELAVYKAEDFDDEGKLLDNKTPQKTFTSTTDVYTFDLVPGDYVLHEVSTPHSSDNWYKTAADIPFTIDIEGISWVNKKAVSYVEMVDENAYNIVFHENHPTKADKNGVFRTYGPADLKNNKLDHFYDIPEWAGDEYVFAGWYHVTGGYTATDSPDTVSMTAANFDTDTYPRTSEENPADYHLYARWIKVGTVEQQVKEKGKEYPENAIFDTTDYQGSPIRGFGLTGVQIRDGGLLDGNYSENDTDVRPGGLRFVTSLSEKLLSDINELSSQNAEYGYVVAKEENINTFITNHNVTDTTKYKLQYNDVNVNGVNTTGYINNQRFKNGNSSEGLLDEITAENDFPYVVNVNCTKGTGKIKNDHRNFDKYRLYTLVVTYEGDSADKKDVMLDARAYLRYTDANGKVRVFYNDYKKNMYYGGCLCSFSQVKGM